MLNINSSSLSLRASLLIIMSLIVLPLLFASVFVFYLLNRTVIADYQDVATRHREQVNPLHNVQVAMLLAELPFEEYLATGNPENLLLYRSLLS